jgi:hypothetical protein
MGKHAFFPPAENTQVFPPSSLPSPDARTDPDTVLMCLSLANSIMETRRMVERIAGADETSRLAYIETVKERLTADVETIRDHWSEVSSTAYITIPTDDILAAWRLAAQLARIVRSPEAMETANQIKAALSPHLKQKGLIR